MKIVKRRNKTKKPESAYDMSRALTIRMKKKKKKKTETLIVI